MKTTVYNDSNKIHYPINRVHEFHRVDTDNGWYLDGEVVTKFGIVSVYMESNDVRERRLTRLDFVHNGCLYVRTIIGDVYTPRGVCGKAGRFAREVVEGAQRASPAVRSYAPETLPGW